MLETSQQTFENAWEQRLHAVRNFPPVLRMVWASGPRVVAASLLFRVIASLIPIAMLSVSRLIIDDVVASTAGRQTLPHIFWWLVVCPPNKPTMKAICEHRLYSDRPDQNH